MNAENSLQSLQSDVTHLKIMLNKIGSESVYVSLSEKVKLIGFESFRETPKIKEFIFG